MTYMKIFASTCLFLFAGVGAVSAQNQVVNGTITVQQDAFLNTSSGNTTINGNTTLGSTVSNTITYNGIAVSNLNMGEEQVIHLQNANIGEPSSALAPYSPLTGTLTFFNSAGTGKAKIQIANPGSTNFTYTVPASGINANFVMDQGAQTINGVKSFSTPIAATSGGTGVNTYSTGDIVYAASANPTALTNLPIGTAAQVLGVTAGGVPGWVTNGATITNTTSLTTVSTDQNPFTPSAANSTYIRVANTKGGTININSIDITGVADGRMVTIVNVSSASSDYIMINSQTGSAPANEQIQLPMGQPIILGQLGAATFIYDATVSLWELVSTN
jgi:hypothetical protein